MCSIKCAPCGLTFFCFVLYLRFISITGLSLSVVLVCVKILFSQKKTQTHMTIDPTRLAT